MTLEVKSLTKRFGETHALAGMTFTIRSGELYGFVGSNGAGKTTTMRIIMGVLAADSGSTLLNGEAITFDDRRTFGYMPEERGLYPRMTVGDQLTYFARLHGLSASDARRSMEYWTDRLGVGARRGDQVQNLSLGNQQRVQLAAALVHDPEVLVLDEPFSGLDPLAVAEMSTVLHEKAQAGATVVFSSHQLDLVERLCDRVGIASLGHIAAEGTIAELQALDGRLIYDITGDDPTAVASSLRPLGLTPEAAGHGVIRVSVTPDLTDQDVLHAALQAGPVHTFVRHVPSLTDLFGDVVTVPPTAPTAGTQKKGFLGRLFGGRKS